MVDTYSLVPAEVDIEIVLGDEFVQTATANRDLTGYTFEASVASLPITVTSISNAPTTSTIQLSLTEAEVTSLGQGEFPWRLRWTAPGDIRRTVVAGKFKVTTR